MQTQNDAQSAKNVDYDAVVASYYRCEDSDGFFDTFYDLFFAKSPEIPVKFAKTDMEKQKQVVMASLLWMLRLYKGDAIARTEVEMMAESHSRRGYDIRPELYELWLDALCESVARHDPDCTPELQSQWRRVIRVGIDVMQSKYAEQSDDFDIHARMHREHKELRELIGRVHRTLTKRTETVAQVTELMASLSSHVENHFRDEETDGFFDDLVRQAPRLSNRTEALRDEHATLLVAVRKLPDVAAAGDGSDAWWQQLESGFHNFSKDLMKHESSENELLQQAYTDDIGSMD